MKIRKVLFVASIYKPNIGGVETAISRLCEDYAAKGIETAVLTKRYPYDLPETSHAEYEVIYRVSRPKQETDYHATLEKILSWEECLKADVIHVVGVRRPLPLFAFLLSQRWKVPVVVSFVGGDVPSGVDAEEIAIWQEGLEIVPQSIVRGQGFHAFSESIAATARAVIPELKHPIEVIYTGLDLAQIITVEPAVLPFPFLLAVRRLVYPKGIDILIRAFSIVHKSYPELHLVIVGDGPEKDDLVELASTLSLSGFIHFIGEISLDEVFAHMKAAAIHICPSRTEGGGTVNVLAAACGCPAIGSNIEGIPEYIQNYKTGLLFTSENPQDLANKILELYSAPALREKVSEDALLFSQKFDTNRISGQFLSLYNKVLAMKVEYSSKPWSSLTQKLLNRALTDDAA